MKILFVFGFLYFIYGSANSQPTHETHNDNKAHEHLTFDHGFEVSHPDRSPAHEGRPDPPEHYNHDHTSGSSRNETARPALPPTVSELTLSSLKVLAAELNAINGIQITFAGAPLIDLINRPEELMAFLAKGIVQHDWDELSKAIEKIQTVKKEVITRDAIGTALELGDKIKEKQDRHEDATSLKQERDFWEQLGATANREYSGDNWQTYHDQLPFVKDNKVSFKVFGATRNNNGNKEIGLVIQPNVTIFNAVDHNVNFYVVLTYATKPVENNNNVQWSSWVKDYICRKTADSPQGDYIIFIPFSKLKVNCGTHYYLSASTDVYINGKPATMSFDSKKYEFDVPPCFFGQ